jgi:hypothetical protein
MTNAMIILEESVRLMEEGKLSGSGTFVEIENEDGTKKHLELPEEIHTFAGWKARGYAVRKGEKSFIKFPIWKHTSKKIESEDGEESEFSRMIIKTSSFFTKSQVEPIKA